MSIFGFLSIANPSIVINFLEQSSHSHRSFKIPGNLQQSSNTHEIVTYSSDENIRGTVDISIPPGKRVEHLGIKVELVGHIEQSFNRGNNIKFLTLVRELEPCGVLIEPKKYSFEFTTEKPYESYSGSNIQLRYFIKVTLSRNYGNNLSQERDICVQTFQNLTNQLISHEIPVRMEVGIEDCLHIEFEYDKPAYHLSDAILGKIYFTLIRIKIKNMELCIVRRETASSNGSSPNVYTESESIVKYELMDGYLRKGNVCHYGCFYRI